MVSISIEAQADLYDRRIHKHADLFHLNLNNLYMQYQDTLLQ